MAGPLCATPPSLRIMDAHTHFYDPTRPQGVPWPSKDSEVLYRPTLPPRFRKMVEPLGVAGTVVIEASPWVEDNQWLLDLAKDEPFIAGVVGNLELGTPEFRGRLKRFAGNRLFRGIRTHSSRLAKGLSQAEFLDDLRLMADLDLELDVGGGPEMFPELVRLSDRVPVLRVVINHLPFDQPGGPAMRELRGRPRVFAKVSSLVRRWDGVVRTDPAFFVPALDELWDVFGPDRVVYGSNWPVTDLYGPYTAVLHIVSEYFNRKGSEAARKYFRDNSKTVYQWIDRSA